MAKRTLTPHQKIMRAAERGTGVRLTADEVFHLSMDDAVSTCAANDDESAWLPRKSKFAAGRRKGA